MPHYNRWYKFGDPGAAFVTPTACVSCGGEIPPRPAGTSGVAPKYCSQRCRSAAALPGLKAAQKLKRDAARATRRCRWPECEALTGTATKWCPEHSKAQRRAQSRDSMTAFCTAEACERPLRARGFCAMHYARLLRSEGRLNEPWDDRRRSNAQARRARQAGSKTNASIYLSQIVERDGTDCKLCGEPVDMDLRWPDRMSRSVDHIIPISRGGIHAPQNCQLAHLACNSSKGNRI